VFMSIQPCKPECSVTSITERLAIVLARGRELESLSAWDMHGRLRMREIVQVNRARMDFERFRKALDLELSNLHTSLSDALSIAMETPGVPSSTTRTSTKTDARMSSRPSG
jgi:hypothetical protein